MGKGAPPPERGRGPEGVPGPDPGWAGRDRRGVPGTLTWGPGTHHSTAGHGITIFLAPPNEFDPESALFEVCLPVTGDVTGDDKVTVKELPACIVAFAMVKGPYHKIPAHYSEILAWLSAQGMETVAPPREVYIKHPDAQGRGDPSEFLTEIQFPINE